MSEAEVLHNGERLGPVGGHLVAETFIAILANDPNSYVNAETAWTPATEPVLKISPWGSNTFEMKDIVKYVNEPRPAYS